MDNSNFFSYEESVAYAADNKLNNVIYNKGEEHAIIIFHNIFRTAEREIVLYAKNIFSLDNKVTTNAKYISSLTNFLEKEGTKLKIVLTDCNADTDTNILREHLMLYRDKIEIKANEQQTVKIDDTLIHFCTADGRMYRMEYDIKDRKARCNFNDQTSCTKFNSIFNILFTNKDAKSIYI